MNPTNLERARQNHGSAMTVRNSLDQLRGSFGQLLCRDAEMNCSKDFTPRLRLWSTLRWGALNIELSSQ